MSGLLRPCFPHQVAVASATTDDFSDLETTEAVIDVVRAKLGDRVANTLAALVEDIR
jgi:hypothetical protein